MYDELIKWLRNRRICIQQSGSLDDFPLLQEAADAIEELSETIPHNCFCCVGCEIEPKDGQGCETGFALSPNRAKQYIDELSKPKWIPVTERLPEEMNRSRVEWCVEIRPSDDVLVWLSHEKRQIVAWYSHTHNEWITVDENTVYCFGEVTHWMPLPEPPKEET